MPPNRRAAAPIGVLASVLTVTSAGLAAAVEGVLPVQAEPIIVTASLAGMGLVFLYLAGKIMATSETVKETHTALFSEHTGVFTTLKHHEARADRHSTELQALRDAD